MFMDQAAITEPHVPALAPSRSQEHITLLSGVPYSDHMNRHRTEQIGMVFLRWT